MRGGGWRNYVSRCRSAARGDYSPDYPDKAIGFRVALAPVK